MLSRAAVVLLLAPAALLASPSRPAAAEFAASGSGSGLATSQAIAQSAPPIPVVTGREVTVSWSMTTLTGGTPAGSYTVRRYDTSDVAQTVLAACDVVTATSCVENNVPIGTWTYSVQAGLGSWVGVEGPKSAPVTVATSSFVLDSTAPIVALPATLTGTIANYLVGETLTYRLDSTTGPVLAGSPLTVTSSTSMAVSVTVPAGTSDAPHSVFVVGSGGSFASAAINIVFPPLLQSMQMRDVNGNGKVDQVTVVFDETLAAYTAGIAPWTLANVPSAGSLASVVVAGSTATLTIAEGLGAADTTVGSFTVALSANSAGVRDVNGHQSSFAATAPTDVAAPAVVAISLLDNDIDGRVDRVTATFSEALLAYTAGTTPWSLTNVPSGGTLASVSLASPTLTLTITEGAGAANTAVGTMTVAMAANAGGARDAAGNQSSFTATTPLDAAAPALLTLNMLDNDIDGKVDRVTATFSEALLAYTAGTTPWTLANVPSGGTLASVSLASPTLTLTINEGAGAANTAVGTMTVAMAANAGGARDAAGNQSSFTSIAPTDRAAPALLTLSLLDTNSNGKVNRVTAIFSETLSAYSAGTAPWTLTNVPSGGTLASVTRATATLTLTLTEGGGAPDTAVGAMTVAMAANALGARDATGNQSSFAAMAPLDAARPVVFAVTDTNVNLNGRAEPGDTISITFTEALAPASVPTSTTVSLRDPNTTADDTLTMVGVSNGARGMGSNAYVTNNNTVASFTNSTVTRSNGDKTITVTISATCSAPCAVLATQGSPVTYSYRAATTLTDVAGNLVVANNVLVSIQLF